jgi:adenylyltransferase/sulfurtransferase
MSKDIKFNFLNSDEEERYQKHLTLKEIGYEGQLNLKNSSVLCIGAGGLGSSVLLYLAAAGIGRIGIVDNDQVEKSNLQRQIIHETNTIGNLKIDSARERIKKFNPNCEILTFSERINLKIANSICFMNYLSLEIRLFNLIVINYSNSPNSCCR